MVNAAQNALPNGYRLQVSTALRTLGMQRSNWDSYYQQMRSENPDWPTSALRRATNKFHAPYDQKAPPGHCTGGAVDVLLLDSAGELLDLTSPLTFWRGLHLERQDLPEAKSNRMILSRRCFRSDFELRDEYWHYSWGDSAWAVRLGESSCQYGWAHAPIAVETDFPGAGRRRRRSPRPFATATATDSRDRDSRTGARARTNPVRGRAYTGRTAFP